MKGGREGGEWEKRGRCGIEGGGGPFNRGKGGLDQNVRKIVPREKLEDFMAKYVGGKVKTGEGKCYITLGKEIRKEDLWGNAKSAGLVKYLINSRARSKAGHNGTNF